MGKKAKGKRTGLKGVYGAKISTGKMPAFGIIRKTVDANKEYLEKQIGENLLKALTKKAKELGLQSKYY
jgi:N-acetylglutamate synthase-like GNAT family acetyltransferase